MPYPDWVLKYKKTGMYVQKKDEHTYRIYRDHSERRPDKSYPVLVTDGYIGTITKEKGLIRSEVKIKGEVVVKRFGGFSLLKQVFRDQANTLAKRYGDQRVFLASCLLVLYGSSNNRVYEADWMSEQYRGLEFPLEQELAKESARIARGMQHRLTSLFGEDKGAVRRAAETIYRVRINGTWITSDRSQAEWVRKTYGISWGGC